MISATVMKSRYRRLRAASRDLGRGRRIERADKLPYRHGRDEVAAGIRVLAAVGGRGGDRAHAALPALNRDHRFTHFERGAAALDGLGQLLPHLAGTVQRIAKAIDQGLDDRAVALTQSQRTLDQHAHGEVLDPLGCPIGANLTAWDAPDLLGVAAEECLVQPPPEGVDHPVLEAANIAVRPHAGRKVTQHAGG